MSTTVIVGAGSGLSASLARTFAAKGHDLVLSARNIEKLETLASETGARCVAMNAADPEAMGQLFENLPSELRVAIYNPSARQRGSITDLDPEEVRSAIEITAFGAFLMGQQAAQKMLQNPVVDGCKGTILFTGASAGVKGFAQSAPFAMGKFAQRGLAQSMARELHPQGIHVAWVNIDGGISNTNRAERTDDGTDKMLNPDEIAKAYLHLTEQHRSTWSDELSLRPWVEKF